MSLRMSGEFAQVCGEQKRLMNRYPKVAIGRPDLAKEWDPTRNEKQPQEVSLGSGYKVILPLNSGF